MPLRGQKNATCPNYLNMLLCGRDGNIQAIYEAIPLNEIARITVYRTVMLTIIIPQPDYIYSFGHLAKSVKKRKEKLTDQIANNVFLKK